MEQFNNGLASHQHSLAVLEQINVFMDFMDSVTTVADMGCGEGYDINWWANAEWVEVIEDEAGNELDRIVHKRNYKCYAVDRDTSRISPELLPANANIITGDIERRILPREVDVIWCHDTFQYMTNPMATLKLWNEQMVENGMMYIGFPQQTAHVYNRLAVRSVNYSYFNHNFLSMVYMLAVNGFDCRDAYFLKQKNNPWLHCIVYKSAHEPMDPRSTSWNDLAERNLINESMKNSLSKYGHIKQEDILYAWLDRQWYKLED